MLTGCATCCLVLVALQSAICGVLLAVCAAYVCVVLHVQLSTHVALSLQRAVWCRRCNCCGQCNRNHWLSPSAEAKPEPCACCSCSSTRRGHSRSVGHCTRTCGANAASATHYA